MDCSAIRGGLCSSTVLKQQNKPKLMPQAGDRGNNAGWRSRSHFMCREANPIRCPCAYGGLVLVLDASAACIDTDATCMIRTLPDGSTESDCCAPERTCVDNQGGINGNNLMCQPTGTHHDEAVGGHHTVLPRTLVALVFVEN